MEVRVSVFLEMTPSFSAQTKQFLQDFFIPPFVEDVSGEKDMHPLWVQGTEGILTSVLRVMAVLGAVAFTYWILFGDATVEVQWVFVAQMLLLLAVWVLGLFRQIGFKTRAVLGSGALFALSMINLIVYGVSDSSRIYSMIFIVFVSLLFGYKAGFGALVVSTFATWAIGRLIIMGRIPATLSYFDQSGLTLEELNFLMVDFVFANTLILLTFIGIYRYAETVWQREKDSTRALKQKSLALRESLNRETTMAETLQHALRKEKEVSDLKSKIITTVSHEFRTPLTVIQNSTNMLTLFHDRLTDEKRQLQGTRVSDSVDRLVRLLENISAIELLEEQREKIHLEKRPFNVFAGEWANVFFESIPYTAPLNIDYDISNSQDVVTDPEFVERITYQLIDNACKFSPDEAPVTARFFLEDGNLCIQVIDEGIGISPSIYEDVFRLFYRVDQTGSIQGLGVGLYIVDNLVKEMHGSIDIQPNSHADGTTFTVKLPNLS